MVIWGGKARSFGKPLRHPVQTAQALRVRQDWRPASDRKAIGRSSASQDPQAGSAKCFFPHPDGPNSTKNSPSLIVRSIFFKAVTCPRIVIQPFSIPSKCMLVVFIVLSLSLVCIHRFIASVNGSFIFIAIYHFNPCSRRNGPFRLSPHLSRGIPAQVCPTDKTRLKYRLLAAVPVRSYHRTDARAEGIRFRPKTTNAPFFSGSPATVLSTVRIADP